VHVVSFILLSTPEGYRFFLVITKFPPEKKIICHSEVPCRQPEVIARGDV
jgi:hypothetical protein